MLKSKRRKVLSVCNRLSQFRVERFVFKFITSCLLSRHSDRSHVLAHVKQHYENKRLKKQQLQQLHQMAMSSIQNKTVPTSAEQLQQLHQTPVSSSQNKTVPTSAEQLHQLHQTDMSSSQNKTEPTPAEPSVAENQVRQLSDQMAAEA